MVFDSLVGTQIGNYRIDTLIGRGGMASVYQVFDTYLQRTVAMKIIHRAVAIDIKNLERFKQEASLIAQLEHPHLLPVHDFNLEHDPPYIIMRYLEGGTLSDVLRTGKPLPLGEISHVIGQVAGALDYAHRRGVIHRDIKPSNIMIDVDGNVFVADFGIARVSDSEGLTQTNVAVGTPGYMSPEQGEGRKTVDHRTDIYSLGVLIYEMATGQQPYKADTGLAMILAHMQEPIPSACTVNPDLPDSFDGIIQKAMAKKPEDRYERARDLADDLTELAGMTATQRIPREIRQIAQEIVDKKHQSQEVHPVRRTPTAQPVPTQPSNADERTIVDTPAPITTSSPQLHPQSKGGRSWMAYGILGGIILLGLVGVVLVMGGLGGGGEDATADETATALAAAVVIDPTATEEPPPTATVTQEPTATTEPSATPTEAPTNTPQPTATTPPTSTPEPTATATQEPTATAQPSATSTEAPTNTPQPTITETPLPSAIALAYDGVTRNADWMIAEQTFVDSISMVLVPAGCFDIGGNRPGERADGIPDCIETPYYIDRTEVTRAMYGACMDAGVCSAPTIEMDVRDSLPVAGVTWAQAQDFCAWRGDLTESVIRLPTEKEWEYAARGPDNLAYPWGNTYDAARVYFDSSTRLGTSVATLTNGESWVGARHMVGNVAEWTSTLFSDAYPYPYATNDGRESLSQQVANRVIRGGSFRGDTAEDFLAARRNLADSTNASRLFGFRCMREIAPGR